MQIKKCLLLIFALFTLSTASYAKDNTPRWTSCKSFLSNVVTTNFNRFTKKAYGFPLIHNLKTLYASDLYFSDSWRPTTWGKSEGLIGKNGYVYIWAARESVWLWEGKTDTFDGFYQSSQRGRLIGYSNIDGTVEIEKPEGQVIKIVLAPKLVKFYSLKRDLKDSSTLNHGWDGDIVGLSDSIGFIVTFIPDEIE